VVSVYYLEDHASDTHEAQKQGRTQQLHCAKERRESEMTAQKTFSVGALFALIAGALSGAWGYARAGDPYSLVSVIFFALASVMMVVILRRPGATYPGPYNPANAGRTIAKFVGFAAACWLLVFVRVRGDIQSLVDPLNVLVLLASFVALALGLQFALQLRESRRSQKS